MSINVKKITLTEQQSQNDGQIINNDYLGLVGSIEVQCNVRIGTLNMTIAQLKQLQSEQVLHLEQKTHEPVELILNNKVIAKGELMSHGDHFALQITEVTG